MQSAAEPRAKIQFAAAANFGWLLGERAARVLFTVGVGFLVARHLGPERFGTLGYCLAVVTLAGIMPALGLDPVVKREIIEAPARAGVLLAESFRVRLVAGAVTYAVLVALLAAGSGGTGEERRMIALLGVSLFQPALFVPDLWLQAKLLAKWSVWSQTVALAAGAAVRLVLIMIAAPLIAFAAVTVFELAVSASVLAVVSRRAGLPWARPAWSEGRKLLVEAWPLVFANLAIMIYMKTDEVMLRKMLGAAAVGTYSAATRLTEIWYFLPIALGSSLLPALVRSRQVGGESYRRDLQRYYDLNVAVAYMISIPLALSATWIVRAAYGTAYLAAAPIVAVHVWSSVFVFLGVARGQWLVNERLQKFYLLATVAGAGINILLNLVLIPRWGGVGAAVATVISQASAAWLSSFLTAATRETAIMQTRALLLPALCWRYLRPPPAVPGS